MKTTARFRDDPTNPTCLPSHFTTMPFYQRRGATSVLPESLFPLLFPILLIMISGVTPAIAQIVENHAFTSLNLPIPDGNASGLSDVQTINSPITNLASLRVSLSVTGEFSGDLFVYLRHVHEDITNFCVLLNRVGRTTTNQEGYPDSGLVVTLEDAAAADIHLYGLTTNLPPGTQLTGAWQPDGRSVDPDDVLDTTPRTTDLAGFLGGPVNGAWTLFLADVHAGGTNMLAGWGLEFNGTGAPVTISGTVAYAPTNYPASDITTNYVAAVTMNLSGGTNFSVLTQSNGVYSPGDLAAGNTYGVAPYKTDDVTANRGVDILDLVLLRAHILASLPLNTPYKLMAAEVSGDGSIDILDLVLVRSLILASTNQFPIGLWRFVPADHVFANPHSPWTAPNQCWHTNLLANATEQNFFAVKLGDVDLSWTAPASPSSVIAKASADEVVREAPTPEVKFKLGGQRALSGQRVSLPLRVSGFKNVSGVQFSLSWDPALLRYAGADAGGLPGLSPVCFGAEKIQDGKLTFAWHDPKAEGVTVSDGTAIFAMQFDALGEMGAGSRVDFTEQPTAAVVAVGWDRGVFLSENGYVEVGVPPVIGVSDAGFNRGAFRLSVQTVPGARYILEFTDHLPASNWNSLPPVEGNGAVIFLEDPSPAEVKKFYRVRSE